MNKKNNLVTDSSGLIGREVVSFFDNQREIFEEKYKTWKVGLKVSHNLNIFIVCI